jgi:hypothetical protein
MRTAGQQARDTEDGRAERRHRRQRVALWALGALCLLAVAVVVTPFGESHDYDLVAGRRGHRYSVWGITVWRSTRDTSLTRLYRRVVGTPPAPEWRGGFGTTWCVREWGWTHIIWDGIYGSEIGAANSLGDLLQGPFTEEARRKAVLAYLDLTRRRRPAAEDYAERLRVLAGERQFPDARPIGPADLPDPQDVLSEWPPTR